ncbi:MAG: helix-turn-helix transcriptional regulator [Lachnospiraceae bacterium]|nr:helix-turn-helix transcriptional regulator [Lachnospiraceae bacterium]MBD5481104.1 helix-turn-helix transcriptional regulator [Lachnospiraceae bacterium]
MRPVDGKKKSSVEFHTINMEMTGKRLHRIFCEKGVSVKEIADLCGCSKTAIYKWFRGETNPSIDNYYAISRFLGVHMEELIAGDDELFPLVFAQ